MGVREVWGRTVTEERVDFSKPKVSTTWLTEDVTRDQIDHSLNVVLARLTGQQQSRPEVDEPETVTITIIRKDAEAWLNVVDANENMRATYAIVQAFTEALKRG